jgi:multiple sugar transport system substrate-binding protein
MSRRDSIGRRDLLGLLGAGSVVSVAGCLGGGGNGGSGGGGGGGSGGGSGSDFASAAQQLGLGENWEQRRIGAADDWPMEARQQVPDRAQASGWTNSGAFESAVENDVWAPPQGWDDTPAGEVDSIQILNHGAVNMEFDPATLATHEYFEEVTDIAIEPIEIGVDQATQREQQVLSSQQSSPQAMNINEPLVPVFVQQGYLEATDALYPQGVWDPYIPSLQSLVQSELGPSGGGPTTYGYPNIVEGGLGHLRPDLVQEQGIDPARFDGEWSWDLLEETMQAFEGTDLFGYAYYAGTSTYLSYSFRELLYQQGGRMVQDDGTVTLDTPEAVRVVQKMKEWRDKGWVPEGVITYGEGNIVDLFLSEQLAFTTGFSDFTPQALSQFGSEAYRPVRPPSANVGPNPSQAALISPNSTSINPFAGTGPKLAAMLYGDLRLSYLSQWWELTYEGNASYLDQVYTDAANAGVVNYADVLGSSIESSVLELFPQMAAVFQQMVNPIQRAITGETSPQQAMSQVQSFVDDEVNQ